MRASTTLFLQAPLNLVILANQREDLGMVVSIFEDTTVVFPLRWVQCPRTLVNQDSSSCWVRVPVREVRVPLLLTENGFLLTSTAPPSLSGARLSSPSNTRVRYSESETAGSEVAQPTDWPSA